MFEQQVDRLVVNVQNSITAAGGTALEVLERSPGITVNRQNNSLTMSGKGGVLVMMNGKLTRLPIATVVQMLEGMTANDIEKIELITTPPARYDAEGDAGIINIITKKNTNFGMNGNFSATLGYGWYARPSGSLNLNYRHQKLNLYGNVSFFSQPFLATSPIQPDCRDAGRRVRPARFWRPTPSRTGFQPQRIIPVRLGSTTR